MIIDENVYLKTQLNKKLYSMLKNIWDNEEFILGVMTFCFSKAHQQKMIDVINSGIDNKNEITLWAISIGKNKDINQLQAKWL